MLQPREARWSATLRILAYIKVCPGKSLMCRKHGYVHISGYSDSDYVGDRGDMKSTTGYCTIVGENFMTWRSKKQDLA